MPPLILYFLLVLTFPILSGCNGQQSLYADLSQSSANEVMAELISNGIPVKSRRSDSGFSVLIHQSDIARAVHILSTAGLPREPRADIGSTFEKAGIISTPFEERARYIYALAQEMESTLTQIDGVTQARVQVVLPDRVAPGEPVHPASASVFIKHNASLTPDALQPRIRQLVMSSIPGLSEQGRNSSRVSIVFVPTREFADTGPEMTYFGPYLIPRHAANFWKMTLIISSIVVLLLCAGIGWLFWRRKMSAATPLPSQPIVAPTEIERSHNDFSVASILGLQHQATNDAPPAIQPQAKNEHSS